jgi:hypothetical protein
LSSILCRHQLFLFFLLRITAIYIYFIHSVCSPCRRRFYKWYSK